MLISFNFHKICSLSIVGIEILTWQSSASGYQHTGYHVTSNLVVSFLIIKFKIITTEIIIPNAWKNVQWKNATWSIIPKDLVKSINDRYNKKVVWHVNAIQTYLHMNLIYLPISLYKPILLYTNLLFFLCLFMSPWLSLNIPLAFSYLCSCFPF